MGYREFNTAVEQATTEESAPLEWKVDGVECKGYRPEPAQFAVLLAQTGRWRSENDKIAGIIDFFVSVCDDKTQSYLIDRLLDRKDKFGLKEVQDIMEWMVEEWSGNPTLGPSVSTSSPSSTGKSLTPTTQ